jgi:hypothetical protein
VTPHLQAKLRVSQPGDSAELEADRVADAVMQMPDSAPQVARDADKDGTSADIQPKCTECAMDAGDAEKKEEKAPADVTDASKTDEVQAKTDDDELQMKPDDEDLQMKPDDENLQMKPDDDDLQMKPDDEDLQMKPDDEDLQMKPDDEDLQMKPDAQGSRDVAPKLESQINSTQNGGTPLPQQTRNFFEPRFGADFSDVRIHTGSQASLAARQLDAKAFTVGNNITFSKGSFSPGTDSGKQLMAHELTHVIQQRGRKPRAQGPTSKEMA